jgi:hypothetical protein
MIRYYVCGLGYDENDCITDNEYTFGDFDTYEQAYEMFVRVQCQNFGLYFLIYPNVNKFLLQLEECEEDDDEISCIDVKNEWWIVNPDFKEEV